MYYGMIIASALLLAGSFVFNKQYQAKNGAAMPSSFLYAALVSAFTLIPLLIWQGFRIEMSGFAWAMAAIYATCCTVYQVLGFVIMKGSSLALYTLFLMSGGMILPYVWGLIFWDEPFSILRTIGLLLILAAVILSSSGGIHLGAKQLALCVAVFVLNGFVSISGKYNQGSPDKGASTIDFMILTNLVRVMLVAIVLLFLARKKEGRPTAIIKRPHTWWLTLGAAVIGIASSWLQLNSASHLPATVLYPFHTGGAIAFTALAGRIFFRERISPRSWASIGCCLIGTCLFL